MMQNSTAYARTDGGAGRRLGHFRSFALSFVCASTVLATVGLLATPSGAAGASTLQVSSVHAATSASSAQGTNHTPAPTSTSSPLSAFQSAYATTTIAPNGLHQTKLSSVPMNYKNSSGKWEAINDSLTAIPSGGWHNTANSVSVQLPSDLSSSVTLANGDASSSIGFTLDGANHAAANEGAVNGSTATYPDALAETTITEQAVTSGVKESLILAASTAPTTFTWDLDLGTGLHASTNGAVIDIDNAGGEVAAISAPTVIDAAGVVGSASYALNAAGTAVTLSLDPSWLTAAARVFPVTVDPTTEYFPGGDDCVLNQGAPTTTACYTNDLAVGYSGGKIQRTVLDYANMSNGFMPVDAQIISAQLSLPVVSRSGSVTVNAYPLSRAYTEGDVTWDTYDGTHSWTTAGGDYTSTPTTSAAVPSSGTMTLNVSTALAQSWVDGSAANNGLVLKASNESSGTNLAKFNPQDDDDDYLLVTWSPNVGVAQGDPMVTHTLDDHLSLGVDAANGNLVVHGTDYSINGTGLNEIVDRYYNSEDLTTDGGMGDSWSLGEGAGVYLQVDSDNVTVILPGGQPAVFMDSGTTWTTPPGINAVLSEPTSGHYSLTFNQSQEVLKFAAEGSCTGGQLPETSVTDRNGETVTYGYGTACDPNGEAMLSTITDTEGRVTNVNNNGYFYSGVNDPQTPSLRSVYYTVSSSATLTQAEDTSGNITHYTYDGAGAELTQIEDPNGNYTVISYDGSGRVSSLTYITNVGAMTGPTYTFAYTPGTSSSPNSGYTTVTDPNSHTTTYYYNDDDQQTKVTDGNGNNESTAYNADNAPTTLTDAMTSPGVSTNSYDASDNQTEALEPANGTDTAAASYANYQLPSGTLGNTYLPSSSVDAQGNCSVDGYDANGNQTNTYSGEVKVSGVGEGTNPGCSSTSTYSSHTSAGYDGDSGVSCTNAKTGQICWTKDGDGNETTYAYDASGDLATVTPPSPQGATTYTYDSLSRVASVTNGDGNSGTPGTITTVQSATTNLTTADASTQTTTLSADTTVGDTVVVAASANGTTLVPSVSSISGGGVGTWHLGKAESTTATGDEEIWYGAVTTAGSDSLTVNWSASTTLIGTFATELSGVAASSPLDVSGSTSGTSTTVSTPSLTTTAVGDIVVDAASTDSPISSSPASPWVDYTGPTQTLCSTTCNPVTDRVVGATGAYSTSWTESPSATWLSVGIALKAAVESTSYTYDAMDRVTQILYGGDTACVPSSGNCITYTYDADGNVTSRTDNTGTTTYTYDALNRLIDVGNPGGADACSGSSPAGITYAYDGASNLTSSCDALGTTDYSYDAGNRLTSEVEPSGTSGCAVSTHTTDTGCTAFSYDNDNHLLVTQFPGGAKQTSTWTANGKMASIVGANSLGTTETSFVYTYAAGTNDQDLVQTRLENDPSVSSATTVTYGYNLNNALTSAVTTGGSSSTLDYHYDAAGNRCSAAASGTPAVCPTGSGDYASNADDELTTSPSGSYTYDASGNTLTTPQLSNLSYNPKSQTTSVTPSGGSAIASTYSNNGQAERTSDGSTTLVSGTFGIDASTTSGTTTYFIRTNTGTVIGEHVGSTSYYYLHENEGSVVAVINASGSTVADRYAYDPYGVATPSGSTANPFGYASGYTDAATGLVQFGTRYYNPSVGLFTQEDPSGQSAGYLYVGDSPVNGTDPTGLCSGIFGCIASAAESVGSAVSHVASGVECVAEGLLPGSGSTGEIGEAGIESGLTAVGVGGAGITAGAAVGGAIGVLGIASGVGTVLIGGALLGAGIAYDVEHC
jgi:RHS repeat-associated protein